MAVRWGGIIVMNILKRLKNMEKYSSGNTLQIIYFVPSSKLFEKAIYLKLKKYDRYLAYN